MKGPSPTSDKAQPRADLGLKLVAGSWIVAAALLVGAGLWQWIAG
ncbi:hypothetical protein OJ996_05070 [Luteolibacter sp. GHJ8]|uniref:Uncharacterized protein n=1 Tax=Luteolibacter rhizosphaerae TaxID=2989719 RepID=A0ABT3FZT5_9BACT|nr:hypothetical protein [Luteolibacter rhizosphaerae]MCW1912932.1 hypothetical protein [Luteolibacter rhizosphaerae]